MAIITRIPVDALGNAVADQMERDSRKSVAEIRADRARMMRALRSIPPTRRCDKCEEVLPERCFSNVGVAHAPRWLCEPCMWTEGN